MRQVKENVFGGGSGNIGANDENTIDDPTSFEGRINQSSEASQSVQGGSLPIFDNSQSTIQDNAAAQNSQTTVTPFANQDTAPVANRKTKTS